MPTINIDVEISDDINDYDFYAFKKSVVRDGVQKNEPVPFDSFSEKYQYLIAKHKKLPYYRIFRLDKEQFSDFSDGSAANQWDDFLFRGWIKVQCKKVLKVELTQI